MYVVVMVASNMNSLCGERLRSGDFTLVRIEAPPPPHLALLNERPRCSLLCLKLFIMS